MLLRCVREKEFLSSGAWLLQSVSTDVLCGSLSALSPCPSTLSLSSLPLPPAEIPPAPPESQKTPPKRRQYFVFSACGWKGWAGCFQLHEKSRSEGQIRVLLNPRQTLVTWGDSIRPSGSTPECARHPLNSVCGFSP